MYSSGGGGQRQIQAAGIGEGLALLIDTDGVTRGSGVTSWRWERLQRGCLRQLKPRVPRFQPLAQPSPFRCLAIWLLEGPALYLDSPERPALTDQMAV